MPKSIQITTIVATRNEEANISKCLSALAPAARVVVVDSGSTDRTAEIASQRGAEVFHFDYRGGYPKKRQWALDNVDIRTEWTLLIDADEVVPPDLWSEIGTAISAPSCPPALMITKGFHFLGRRFRFGGFSFAAVLLFRTGKARFERLLEDDTSGLDMEVHERLIVDGPVGHLQTPLIHDDFKSLESYLERHNRYSTWEAGLREKVRETGQYGDDSIVPSIFGGVQERRRFFKRVAMRIPGESILWFVYHFFLRFGFLEGRAGLIASRFRSDYIAAVRAKMYEHRKDCKRRARLAAQSGS